MNTTSSTLYTPDAATTDSEAPAAAPAADPPAAGEPPLRGAVAIAAEVTCPHR